MGEIIRSGARSVLDLGCGGGDLLMRLAREPWIRKIVGIDNSPEALAMAEKACAGLGPLGMELVELLDASFTKPDSRLEGFDAAALVETIEHIEPRRLSNAEHAVFKCYRPATVILTTPNREYNVVLGMPDWAFRHPGHHFEWTRAKFRSWCQGVGRRNGYRVRFGDIGENDPLRGSPTQMAIFEAAAR